MSTDPSPDLGGTPIGPSLIVSSLLGSVLHSRHGPVWDRDEYDSFSGPRGSESRVKAPPRHRSGRFRSPGDSFGDLPHGTPPGSVPWDVVGVTVGC